MTTVEPQYERVVVPHEDRRHILRRDLNDLRRPIIPPALLRHPELAALEAQRQRLVQALKVAEHSGPEYVDDNAYIAQRTKALREGTDLPTAPPTTADLAAGREQRERDVKAASDALLALGDDICEAVRQHTEWMEEARQQVDALARTAEDLRRQALKVEQQAAVVAFQVRWLGHVQNDHLYVPTGSAAVLSDDDRKDLIREARP
jgi:hypothetical protein